jgi:hypothetical protein
MQFSSRHCLLFVGFALAACRADSTSPVPTNARALSIERWGHDDGDAARYSDWSAPVNLGAPVNTPFGEQGVSISRSGKSLYFQSDRARPGTGDFDIYVSRRTCTDDANPACAWGEPRNVTAVNSAIQDAGPRLSADGHRLYFNSSRPGGIGGNDLYVSLRRNTHDDLAWGMPRNLGSPINTTANENQADPFEDEESETRLLYFASDRPGGMGLLDIYVSNFGPRGTFSPAVAVAELNTPFNDQQPANRRDGLEMFLGSDRTGTLGSVDLWVTTRRSTKSPWSKPVNLGPVVNTTFTDGRPAISFDGTTLYFQSLRPGGLGLFDLYRTTRQKLSGSGDDNEHGGDDDR